MCLVIARNFFGRFQKSLYFLLLASFSVNIFKILIGHFEFSQNILNLLFRGCGARIDKCSYQQKSTKVSINQNSPIGELEAKNLLCCVLQNQSCFHSIGFRIFDHCKLSIRNISLCSYLNFVFLIRLKSFV